MNSLNPQVVVAFAFGVIFVTGLIFLAVCFPRPTPFQEGTFRTVLSLAAAGVAAMIPGFIDVNLNPTVGVLIRAGGALAVFAIVFFFNPAQLAVKNPVSSAPLDQVAAICYRIIQGSIELLLVRTTGGRWTFPKGKIEEGEESWFAAKREAFEEGGASGEIDRRPITTYLHEKKEWKNKGVECNVEAFLLCVEKTQDSQEKNRSPRWFSVAEAEGALAEGRQFKYAEEFRRVLREAAKRIKEKAQP